MSEPVLAQAERRHVEDFRLGAADFAVSAAGMSWRWVLTQPGEASRATAARPGALPT